MTIEEAQKKLSILINEVAESHEPAYISSGNHTAVLLSVEDWEAVQKTLYLTSIPGMREAIQEGLNTPIEECSDSLKW